MTTIIGHRKGMVHGPHLYNAAGQIIYSTAAGATAVLAAGATGQLLGTDSTAPIYITPGPRQRPLPTGALAETMPRFLVPAQTGTILVSGTVLLSPIALQKGQVISSATYYSATTALSVGTHQYFGLYSSALARLAVSADDTSTAWAASTAKTLSFTSPYTVTTSGLHYVAILVTATTVPSLFGNTETNNMVTALAPFNGTADTSATSLPTTAAAMTYQTKVPYAIVA